MLSQSGPRARDSRMVRAARVRSVRTRAGSRSSSASRTTGAATPESSTPVAVVVVNGNPRRVRHACSTSAWSRTAASRGRVTRRRTDAASATTRSGGSRSSSITANRSSTTSAGAPDPRARPGRRARASAAATTASGCPCANVRIRSASSPRTPWATRSRSTSWSVSGPTTSSPSRGRHPGAARQAWFGPRRPTSTVVTVAGRACDELVADPAVEQVEPLEAVDHQHVDPGGGDPFGGRRGRRRRRSSQRGAERGERSRHRRLRPAAVQAHPGQRQPRQRPGDQHGLADPARPVHEHHRRSVRGEQCGQARAFLCPTDQGCSRRGRQAVGDRAPRAGLAHRGMLVRPQRSPGVLRLVGTRGPVCPGRSPGTLRTGPVHAHRTDAPSRRHVLMERSSDAWHNAGFLASADRIRPAEEPSCASASSPSA